MQSSKTPIIDLGRNAVRSGVATSRFTITKEQAAELRRIEDKEGQAGGLRYILKLLAARRVK